MFTDCSVAFGEPGGSDSGSCLSAHSYWRALDSPSQRTHKRAEAPVSTFNDATVGLMTLKRTSARMDTIVKAPTKAS